MEEFESLSKFTDYYTTAGSFDSGSTTVDKLFADAMIIAQPVAPLEEKGVITVKDSGAHTDKVVFTVVPESTFTWTTEDTRGSENVTGGDYQQISAATYTEAQPTTKKATIAIADNISLVNPVNFETFAQIAGNQIKQKKIYDALTELTTVSNYTAATSVRNAGGFTSYGSVASDDTLTPNDLVSAKKDLKNQTTPIIPDVCIVHTTQLNQLENHGNFSPGQTTNSNYKKAKFDEDGHLIKFDGMDIIEVLEAEMAQVTSGSFASNNGHFAIIGKKGLMLGRGENNRKNTVEDFRDPKKGVTERTLRVNYDYVLMYPAGVRILACAD